MSDVKNETMDQKPSIRDNKARRRSSFRTGKTSRYLTPFDGGIDELKGHYYDCSSGKQADRYVTTTRNIVEYVGREYKYGGDIRATLENMSQFKIPKPEDPSDDYNTIKNTDSSIITPRDQVSFTDSEMFKNEINEYVRRKNTLITNIQKGYSLVLESEQS